MLTIMTLAGEGHDKTRVNVTWEAHAAATKEEIEAFVKAKSGMTRGWTGAFEKLEEHLKSN